MTLRNRLTHYALVLLIAIAAGTAAALVTVRVTGEPEVLCDNVEWLPLPPEEDGYGGDRWAFCHHTRVVILD